MHIFGKKEFFFHTLPFSRNKLTNSYIYFTRKKRRERSYLLVVSKSKLECKHEPFFFLFFDAEEVLAGTKTPEGRI